MVMVMVEMMGWVTIDPRESMLVCIFLVEVTLILRVNNRVIIIDYDRLNESVSWSNMI